MSRTWQLLHNEMIKIYKRKMFWIMLIILAGIIVLLAAVVAKDAEDHSNWRQELQKEMTAKQSNDSPPDDSLMMPNEDPALYQYQLDHNIPPLYGDTVFGFMNMSHDITFVIVTVFIVIIGGSIVSQEYSWGTIKLLLIRPIHRWKILLAKFLAVVVTGAIMLLIDLALTFIISGIFLGFDMGADRYVYMKGNHIHDVSILYHFLQLFGSALVDLIIMGAFAFMLSTLFKNNALAIGLSVFLFFAGPVVVGILSSLHLDIAKYLFFLNTDLYQYVEGTHFLKDTTLGFSIAVLLVYFILFMLVSFYTFAKRDVTD